MSDQLAYRFCSFGEGDVTLASRHSHYLGVTVAVSSSIDFARVRDLFNDTDFVVFVVDVGLCFVVVGIVDLDFEKMGLVRVCVAEGYQREEGSVVLVGLYFWEPLKGVGGPVERVQEEKIIAVWGLFLPDFVLLVDDHLFFLIELFRHLNYNKSIYLHLQQQPNKPPFMRRQASLISTQLSIDMAIEFVGNNNYYQRYRLLIIAFTVLALAVLNNKMAIEGSALSLLFLIASGAGQIFCPIYFSLSTNTLGVAASALLCFGFYPFDGFLKGLGLLSMGFFSRGFFVNSLVYLNQIGGDRFRAWAMLVIFGIWALSTIVSFVQQKLAVGPWLGYYLFVFLPCLVGSYLLMSNWQPSPMYLYLKKQYHQTKAVLSVMARENDRPQLPYGLQGQNTQEIQYCRATYKDLIGRKLLRKITIPLCIVWIYRQYVYYTSYMMIPQISTDFSRIYMLVSISETIAVLLSYPIRLYIKRINAAAFTVLTVLVLSLPSSFTTVPLWCREDGQTCSSKYLYYIALMMTRFAMSLLGIVLVSYTLEVYPSNVRRLGFSVCLGVSSVGSIVMPWINNTLISLGLSGFITFSLASLGALWFIPKLEQTFGKMRTETLQQLQGSPEISLKNWALLNFSD